MPHVSKVKLDKKLENELLKMLEVVLGRLSKNEMNSFLVSLLSSTERLMLAKRLAVIILLKQGLSENSISLKLGVTRETVARLHLVAELRGQGYDLALEKLKDEKVMKEFKNFLIKLAQYSVRAAGGRVKPTIL